MFFIFKTNLHLKRSLSCDFSCNDLFRSPSWSLSPLLLSAMRADLLSGTSEVQAAAEVRRG